VLASAAAGAAAPPRPSPSAADGGHTALLHSLGDVGDVAAVHMPWLLRLAHIRSRITGGDSAAALQESSRGLLLWKAALERGLVLDDLTIQQLVEEKDSRVAGQSGGPQLPARPGDQLHGACCGTNGVPWPAQLHVPPGMPEVVQLLCSGCVCAQALPRMGSWNYGRPAQAASTPCQRVTTACPPTASPRAVETLRWPEEPLRAVLVRGLSTLGGRLR
jgi:hypothetical protein